MPRMMNSSRLLALLSVIVPSISGCAVAGNAAIRNGRATYNDALVTTNNEQILALIIRMRYQEPIGLLAVASITANVRIQGTVGAQFGVGPDSSFAGNLVPLSAGMLVEENPTISYVPVQGDKYMRQMLSPLPIETTVLLLNALGDTPDGATLLLARINGISNPPFLVDPSAQRDERFHSLAEVLAAMHRSGSLSWVQLPGEHPSFALVLRGQGSAYEQHLTVLHELLGFAKPTKLDDTITLPVTLGPGFPSEHAIDFRTRSVRELFLIAASKVDVPAEHLETGLASPIPSAGAAGSQIRIARSATRPQNALVAVQHRGSWFYIDAADGQSKQTFAILEAILTAGMAESFEHQSSMPVLTVPVSN
jgi:hypothetical protein